MKKVLLILITFVCVTTINAQNPINICDRNKTIDVGFQIGCVGHTDNVNVFSYGVNLSVYGIYFDYVFSLPSHMRDVRILTWENEAKSGTFHVGYQIPLCDWIKITPLIGYASAEIGYTDGSEWWCDKAGICNAFITQEEVSGFDCGVQGNLLLPCGEKTNITFHMTYTRYCSYGGIGLSIKI